MALPDEPCEIQPRSVWTEQEKWVWRKVSKGKIADLNKRDCDNQLDPKSLEGWSGTRVLRPAFLETVVLHEPYRSALPHHGVRIIGAWFKQPIELPNAALTHELWLDCCRFEEKVDLNFLRSSENISLEGSTFLKDVSLIGARIDRRLILDDCNFESRIDMDSLRVGDSLFMSTVKKKAEFAEVWLGGAHVGGTLEMDGSKFRGNLNMDKLQVKSGLFMRRGAQFDKEVVLRGAKIGSDLSMTDSTFAGNLTIDDLQVEGNLLMKKGCETARFAGVSLVNARIEGQIDMSRAVITKNLNTDRLRVGQHFIMWDAEVNTERTPTLIFAEIYGNLDLSGCKLRSLDLSGTKIHRELRLGSNEYSCAQWDPDATLILRNTEAGALQDREEEGAWPGKLELEGFTFNRLGGFDAGATDVASRCAGWFIRWLGKQREYSPQPYEQLARVLRKAGHKDKADEVLYAAMERERGIARWKRWLWLTTLNVFIGYGYGYRFPTHPLCCVAILTALGAFLTVVVSNEGPTNWMPYSISYSLDMLLPMIELRGYHYDIDLSSCIRYYFYFHKIMGWVIVSFIIAGLSGLTKK